MTKTITTDNNEDTIYVGPGPKESLVMTGSSSSTVRKITAKIN